MPNGRAAADHQDRAALVLSEQVFYGACHSANCTTCSKHPRTFQTCLWRLSFCGLYHLRQAPGYGINKLLIVGQLTAQTPENRVHHLMQKSVCDHTFSLSHVDPDCELVEFAQPATLVTVGCLDHSWNVLYGPLVGHQPKLFWYHDFHCDP